MTDKELDTIKELVARAPSTGAGYKVTLDFTVYAPDRIGSHPRGAVLISGNRHQVEGEFGSWGRWLTLEDRWAFIERMGTFWDELVAIKDMQAARAGMAKSASKAKRAPRTHQ